MVSFVLQVGGWRLEIGGWLEVGGGFEGLSLRKIIVFDSHHNAQPKGLPLEEP